MRYRVLAEGAGARTIAVVLAPGEDPMAELADIAKRLGLTAAHFTAIGAFSSVVVGFFDPEARDYKRTAIEDQVEVASLVGNIALEKGRPRIHAHVVVTGADGAARGGHLLEGRVRPTLEIVIVESPQHLRRVFDAASGLALLDLR